MDTVLGSEADALWEDVIDLLEQEAMAESTIAMLRSCTPISMSDSAIRVETSMRLVQKNLYKNIDKIEAALTKAAFTPMQLEVDLVSARPSAPVEDSYVAPPAANTFWESTEGASAHDEAAEERRTKNPLVDEITEHDSRLTFERFVQGDENIFAYQAALQVAEGENKTYNPLFIYGKSGLGKTHLLRAIQNYIAQNDPSRLVVYKEATSFIDDYVQAMKDREKGAPEMLKQNYHDVDVLIIDDIQKMAGAGRTIDFFFDTFNYLTGYGKQIVLAADRSPAQLGMGKDRFDERVTSRIDSGFSINIQVPNYELKLRLINTFYERMKEDAKAQNIAALDGTLPEEIRKYMAENAGTNIRLIEGFCQSCLITASRKEKMGQKITHDDIQRIVREKWPSGRKNITVDEIQKAVENYYDIAHSDLIGNKRNKELMEPRHIAIWLTRELTDITLAEIGKRFGGRTHATVKHSISWVEEMRKSDKNLFDQINRIQENITEKV